MSFWIIALLVLCILTHQLGYRSGWRDGIRIARIWEGTARDYRMMLGMARADTEEEVKAACEIRQLERMYHDV